MLYSSGSKGHVLQGLEEALESIAKVKSVVEQLPDLPEWARVWATDTELHVNVPFDWQKYQAVRRALGGEFDSMDMHSGDCGALWRRLCHRTGVNLDIILDPRLEDSACQLVKVGEKVTPIFEARC